MEKRREDDTVLMLYCLELKKRGLLDLVTIEERGVMSKGGSPPLILTTCLPCWRGKAGAAVQDVRLTKNFWAGGPENVE